MTDREQAAAGRDEWECDRVAEALPFLLNGSLSAAERGAVSVHLGGCARCRADLQDVGWVWLATDAHPDERMLVAYAEGRRVDGMSRSVLEAHLAQCSTCTVALDGVYTWLNGLSESAPEAEWTETAQASSAGAGGQGLRSLALAAGLFGVVVLAMIWWVANRELRREAAVSPVQIVELFPQSSVRSAESAASGAVSLNPSPDAPLVLVLVPTRPPSGEAVRVLLFDQDGRSLAEVSNVEVRDGSCCSVLLPSPLPRSPSLLIRLVEGDGEPEILGEYRLSLGS